VLAIGLTLEVWWAFSPAAYNGTITINYPNDGITTQGVDNYALLAFGVSGAGNPRSPWDVNASLPDPDTHYYGDYRGTLAALDMVPSLSTTAPNSFIFVVGGAVPGSSLSFSANALADVTDGYVDTNLPAGAFEGGQSVSLMSEYLIAGAPQVALTPNFAYAGDTWCMIADAISGAGAAGAARRVFFVA
jgi:hypothetical protein